LPVSNTRTRAASFAGTSNTVSPSATRRWAMLAGAVAVLHRPRALREPSRRGQHLPVALDVGGVPALVQYPFAVVEDLDGHRVLVGIRSDHYLVHCVLSATGCSP